jgi:hypothetical protein
MSVSITSQLWPSADVNLSTDLVQAKLWQCMFALSMSMQRSLCWLEVVGQVVEQVANDPEFKGSNPERERTKCSETVKICLMVRLHVRFGSAFLRFSILSMTNT